MSSAEVQSEVACQPALESTLKELTLLPVRLALGRLLVAFCFVWPFLNFALIFPGNTMEINFLPVFLAAGILPEITLREKGSIFLSILVIAVAFIGATPAAAMRVAIGVIPILFVLNLTAYLREQNKELLPPGLAYRALQLFLAFCFIQMVHFYLFPVIPDVITNLLEAVVPRYLGVPYDAFGIRGVQGWASEPASAGLTCIAFALVAIRERPDRRWRVMALYALLLVLNKSIYTLVLAILLGFACLSSLRRKSFALLALVPLGGVVILYAGQSGRFTELRNSILIYGWGSGDNHDLLRLAQIFAPLEQFPHLYKPLVLFGDWVAEPIGLLPLVIGYGSVVGLIWLVYIFWHNFPLAQTSMRPFALIAEFALLVLAPPDLIPSVVALAVFSCTRNSNSRRHSIPSVHPPLHVGYEMGSQ